MEKPRERVSGRTLVTALIQMCYAFLGYGYRGHVDRIMDEINHLDWFDEIPNLVIRWENLKAIIATLDGRLQDAVAISKGIIKKYRQQSGISQFANVYAGLCGIRPMIYLGTAEDLLESIVESLPSHPLNPFYLAHLGRKVEAMRALETADPSPSPTS